jgi:hypothetical protein
MQNVQSIKEPSKIPRTSAQHVLARWKLTLQTTSLYIKLQKPKLIVG